MDIYRVTSWGKAVGIGVTGASFIEVSAICKTNVLPDHPYYIANELIAAELERILKLPVPPGFIVEDTSRTPYFASLGFNLTGVALPPILPDHPALLKALPDYVQLPTSIGYHTGMRLGEIKSLTWENINWLEHF